MSGTVNEGLDNRNNHGNKLFQLKSLFVDMTAQGNKNFQKQEDGQTAVKGRSLSSDQLKEDGIRKELYKIEWESKEHWNKKWGFLKNSKKLMEEEAARQALEDQTLDLKRNQMTSIALEGKKPAFNLVHSDKVPLKTSGMIGWRLFTSKNELNRLVGPMYTSPKLTINPPLSPDEPDLTQQKIIYLG